ncbi:PD-(D/E)XK nuclease superfamily protein [Enhydrobacter aerosaccus]|uniref:PD-(D/E)XK nuclease superfamily protein n=1 Tax=Enhydrobacter aerosaccus TaxID=225324 RepID=A0A1T4TLA1_9HYPH|nr:PD-(D/E)XK nuclease family protein [Enhydrobacter aerosaccus]SKA41293.1 PD-(D/E)XK nuclease superfamily protein [Enhydrobacter aerosaccus]
MRWSYSAGRSFRQCQRQWFFKNIVASARANQPLRRRAYLLSKLQSLSAWRGKVVDDVISKTLIPSLNRRDTVTLKTVKQKARCLFDSQLAFALRHPIDDPDLRVSREGEDFALLHGMEYGQAPTAQDVEQAWTEVEQALTNLYNMSAVREVLKSSDYVVSQRALQFELMDDVTALAFPDAIAFSPARPPLIIDWKVHAFGQNDAWLQLAIYAIALSRSKRHADFPENFCCAPKDVVLLEAQLLTGSLREHDLGDDEIIEAEEYMINSACEITSLTEGKKYAELSAEDFRVAHHAETCQRCAFRTICWEKPHAQ